jgi:hypothetical protein
MWQSKEEYVINYRQETPLFAYLRGFVFFFRLSNPWQAALTEDKRWNHASFGFQIHSEQDDDQYSKRLQTDLQQQGPDR